LTAVVRGAAIFGIEKAANRSVPTMSACPRSYGVSVNAAFSEFLHDPRDLVPDPWTQAPVAQDQLKWLIKKGELILSNDLKEATAGPFKKNFTKTSSKIGSFPIYAYDDDDLPEQLARARNGTFIFCPSSTILKLIRLRIGPDSDSCSRV